MDRRAPRQPALGDAERAHYPHVAISGASYRQRWEEILLENCRRFAKNEPLLNVVDKEKWYRRGNGRRTLPQALLREGTKVSG